MKHGKNIHPYLTKKLLDMKYDFRPYINPVFIETGSYVGEGIQGALNSGFQKVISIEIAEYYHQWCLKRFKGDGRVALHLGNSTDVLPFVIGEITDKCTFWLDAHFCGGYTKFGPKRIPILEEIAIIGAHPIKGHTILIDDMRAVQHGFTGDGWNDITIEEIKQAIYKIDSRYSITFTFGMVENDILVAQIC